MGAVICKVDRMECSGARARLGHPEEPREPWTLDCSWGQARLHPGKSKKVCKNSEGPEATARGKDCCGTLISSLWASSVK